MQRIFEREVVSLLIISMLCSAAHYTFKRIFSLLSMKCREKHRYPLHLCLNEYKQKIKDHKQDLSQTTFGFWTF